MRLRFAVLLTACGAASAASANDPKTYTCTFNAGSAYAFEGGGFKSEPAGDVAFVVTDLSAEQQTAKVTGGGRTTTVRLVRAVNAVHVLEAVGEGYLNMTTIYDRDSAGTTHPAVHSRHNAVLGQPVIAQYRGSCAPS
jgi:hypothetical protein